MKKNLRILLFAFVFTFAFEGIVVAASFPDVPEDHPNYTAIEYLDEQEVISGYQDDGTFRPDRLVSRAEAMKFILNALAISEEGSFTAIFPDVKPGKWYFEYVMKAENLGIVDGYEDGLFKPADTVNLAEALKMLTLAAGTEVSTEVEGNIFADVKAEQWFAPYFEYARDKNIVLADDYGMVAPNQDMTRAAFAEVVYRMMIVQEQNGKPFPLDIGWSYFEGETVPFKMKYDDADWEVIKNVGETIFFKPDKEFLQFSPSRVYPNSAVVKVAIYENTEDLSSAQYFGNLRNVFDDAAIVEFNFDGLDALEVLYAEERTVDWYIYLESGDVLAVFTEYGDGALGPQLQKYIKAMLSTLEYQEVVTSLGEGDEQLLSEIFAVVLVEGKGTEVLDKVTDKIIIETDAIGVGTGPIDYYYSASLDYTFKYEREADVILATKKGRTSAF